MAIHCIKVVQNNNYAQMTELKMLVTIGATVCFNDIAQIPPEMWKVIMYNYSDNKTYIKKLIHFSSIPVLCCIVIVLIFYLHCIVY